MDEYQLQLGQQIDMTLYVGDNFHQAYALYLSLRALKEEAKTIPLQETKYSMLIMECDMQTVVDYSADIDVSYINDKWYRVIAKGKLCDK